MKTLIHKQFGFRAVVLAGLVFGIFSCDNKRNKEVDPTEEFSRIYDNQKFTESYYPLDIKPVSDGGYIILGKRRITSSAYYGVYSMKIDEAGQFVSENLVDEQNVNPLSSIIQIGSDYYFICMDQTSLESKLMRIDESASVTEIATIPTAFYPLAAATDGTSILMLNYDRDELQMEVNRISTSGAVSGFEEFNVGFGDLDIEEKVIDHLTGNGPRLPFLIGNTGSTYYFNGYFNYNVSTIFFTFGGGSPAGIIQGYRDERCISSAIPLTGSRFALSRYDYGSNFINTNATVNTAGIVGITSVAGNTILEFSSNQIPVVKQLSIAGKDLLVYGATTQSGQMALYFYEAGSGNFVAAKYLGYAHPYILSNMAVTNDGALIVTGTVIFEGRFPRICVFKLSESQLDAKLNGTEDDKKKKK